MPEEGSTNLEVRGSVKGFAAGQISGGTFHQYFISKESDDEILKRPLNKASPYKGLYKFEKADEKRFFGREQSIESLSEDLEKNNLILLLGASGSGKSSLVRAGIIPKFIEKNFIDLTFVPDKNPFESLYACLIEKYGQENAKIARQEKDNTLFEVVEALNKGSEWLICIDQFEEIFTRTSKEKCDKFINSLVQLIETQNNTVKIILTMRADFCDKFSSHPRLASTIESYIRFITDMSRNELRLAIAEPAARNGVVFEQGLVEQIIDDFEKQVGCLPLLQYTLDLLWKEKKNDFTDRKLNIKTYDSLGGVTGALQKQADTVYTELKPEEKKAAKKIFIELVDVEGDKVISRRTEQAQLKDRVLQETLTKLVNERLLVVSGKQKSTLEVAHETLLTAWTTLQAWIKEAKEALVLRKRLLEDAKYWSELRTKDQEKAKAELWSGSKLEQVLELKDNPAFSSLGEEANEFIDASVAWKDRLLREKEEQIREKEKQNQKLNLALTESRLREKAGRILNLLPIQPLNGLLLAIQTIGENLDQLPKHILHPIQTSLHKAMVTTRVPTLFQGHDSDVNSVAFSPDGQMIASGSRDKTVRLWDIQGNPIGEPLRGHDSDVNSVAFSPDGQMIASGSRDNTVRLWDIQGNPIGEPLRGHDSSVNSVAFSPDGQMIASGSRDNTVRLWDIQGNPIGEPLRGHDSDVNSVAFSPDGQMIASGSSDNTVRLWDIQGNPIGEPLRGHDSSVNSVAFSPDGQMIASGSSDNTVRLWDIQGNPIGEPLRGHDSSVNSVAFSPDGQMIASGSWDNTVRLWDIQGNPIGEPLRGHDSYVYSVAFSPDGQMIASGSSDNTVRLWDIQGNPIGEPLRGHDSYVNSVAFSPDGQMIASGSWDNTVRLWDIQGNPIGEPLRGHDSYVNSVAFSPDGQMIASGSSDNTVRLWDIQGNPIGEPLRGHDSDVYSVAFSPDGQMIASGSSDNTVRLWDIQGNPIGEPLRGHDSSVNSVAFSPDGQMIASGSWDNTVRLWDIQGNPIGEPLRGHDSYVYSVAFSPDGQMIASGSWDNTVRLWDIQGNPIGEPLRGHDSSVNSVAFSPDGQMIASGSSDNTVRLWDIQGNPIGEPLRGHDSSVNSVAFSPDGQMIASGSWDNTVRLWKGSWRAWLQVCCDRLRDHHLFRNPKQGSLTEAACKACQKYVWNPAPADEFNKQGVNKRKEKAFQAAVEDFCRAIQLKPNHVGAYYNRAMTRMELDDYQGAVEDFDYLIRLRPHHAAAHEYRRLCYAKLGNQQ